MFFIICKTENPTEWQQLITLDDCEVESNDQFYIMGTNGRAELEKATSETLLIYKSNEEIYFQCSISNEIVHFLETKETLGFFLIQSELPTGKEQAYKMFFENEIESLICAFYTENKKNEIFKLDVEGNIKGLKQSV